MKKVLATSEPSTHGGKADLFCSFQSDARLRVDNFRRRFTSLPQVRGGRIKVFAVMAKSRTTTAPDIPTVDEAGAPGLYISPWQAVWAPKGQSEGTSSQNSTPRCVRALNDPDNPQETRRAEL